MTAVDAIPTAERLMFRNQFVLGPRYIEEYETWQKRKIGPSLYLSTHPDLSVCHLAQDGKSLTMIGFILDPDDPNATDGDILSGLIGRLSDPDKLPQQTERFGGRWILIAIDGKTSILMNDACGLRQIFYTHLNDVEELWCASQPAMLANLLDLKMSPEAIDFINSHGFRSNPEFRWPGDGSPYKEIKHLLPNHMLNLFDGRCHRYWPHKNLEEISVDQAVEKLAQDFPALMRCAANRFKLAVSLTAGLDSRMVLAASKQLTEKISFMTVRQFNHPDTHADITVASQLLNRLGLEHHVVKSSYFVNDDFLNKFRKNTSTAHYIYLPDAQAILRFYHLNTVAVTGSVSEITRSSYRRYFGKPLTAEITAEDLAKLQKMGANRYALESFKNWLSDLGCTYNIDPLDLFIWEQTHGNWLAMCQLEFDIAWQDIFTPFNCRRVLVTALSVYAKYRRAPAYVLSKKLISVLWPELLAVPINPHKYYKNGIANKLKSVIPYRVKKAIRSRFR